MILRQKLVWIKFDFTGSSKSHQHQHPYISIILNHNIIKYPCIIISSKYHYNHDIIIDYPKDPQLQATTVGVHHIIIIIKIFIILIQFHHNFIIIFLDLFY